MPKFPDLVKSMVEAMGFHYIDYTSKDPEDKTDEVQEIKLSFFEGGVVYFFYYEEADSVAYVFEDRQSFEAVHYQEKEIMEKVLWDSETREFFGESGILGLLFTFLYDLKEGHIHA